MNTFNQLTVLAVVVMFSVAPDRESIAGQAQPQSTATNSLVKIETETVEPKSTIWQSGIGEGFLSTAQDFSIEAGFAPGIATFGSRKGRLL